MVFSECNCTGEKESKSNEACRRGPAPRRDPPLRQPRRLPEQRASRARCTRRDQLSRPRSRARCGQGSQAYSEVRPAINRALKFVKEEKLPALLDIVSEPQ